MSDASAFIDDVHQCLQVEKVQNELDGLAATLKQVELYNEQMKGEIAVTRRWVQSLLLALPSVVYAMYKALCPCLHWQCLCDCNSSALVQLIVDVS